MNMPSDLAARQPVWAALSRLYLDADIAAELDTIATVLAASPYDLAQLRDILRYEVNPVLHWNLHAAAGVWDGFDQAWLQEQILRRRRQPRWWRALATRRALRWHWPGLAAAVTRLREARAPTKNPL